MENTENKASRPAINIYNCGGAGINIGKKVEGYLATTSRNLAPTRSYYIDTSRSNLRSSGVNESRCYLIPGCDGAGKKRAKNYPLIHQHTPSIANEFEPSDLNIFVCSTSGGSGNVIAAKMLAEVVARGKNGIVFAIGSHESAVTCQNSIDTWATLNGIAQAGNFSPVVFYESNGSNERNNEVDSIIVEGVIAVLDLMSNTHERLDSQDVINWLNPNTKGEFPHQALLLDIIPAGEECDIRYPISVATLHPRDMQQLPSVGADYNCDGYRLDGEAGGYFVIHNEGLAGLRQELQEVHDEYEKRAQARSRMTDPNMFGGNQDSSGFVL